MRNLEIYERYNFIVQTDIGLKAVAAFTLRGGRVSRLMLKTYEPLGIKSQCHLLLCKVIVGSER